MQTADAFSIATPADWQPGDDVIVPTAGSCGVAKERMENKVEMHCYDWFFCTKKLPKETVLKTILKSCNQHEAHHLYGHQCDHN